ncbi:hypothetical protein GCM10017559_17490 [Streptosporangium longisporum]|uniref:Uncharacterized protein n=1 Tax=Streptosporangium longisporum TaxID=46187 RepID=A0ABN3XWA3_9ACTN
MLGRGHGPLDRGPGQQRGLPAEHLAAPPDRDQGPRLVGQLHVTGYPDLLVGVERDRDDLAVDVQDPEPGLGPGVDRAAGAGEPVQRGAEPVQAVPGAGGEVRPGPGDHLFQLGAGAVRPYPLGLQPGTRGVHVPQHGEREQALVLERGGHRPHGQDDVLVTVADREEFPATL